MSDEDDRLKREQHFHDHAFAESSRASALKFYEVARASENFYETSLLSVPTGSNCLEYGCGQGSMAFALAASGKAVTGIDISPVGIEQATKRAEAEGLTNAQFQVMDAEALALPAKSFDLVCGSGILHHLDLRKALPEVGRVLAESGKAVFLEPLGHNPLINLYRKRTPKMRTEDEHPLLMSDLQLFGDYFEQVNIKYFHFFSLAAVALRKTPLFKPVLSGCEFLDRGLLAIPFMRRYAWIAVITMSAPRS